MEPVSVGAAVVAILIATGEAALNGAVGEAAKNAYLTLRDRIADGAEQDVKALEQQPASPGRQAVVAELIDARDEEEQEQLSRLARQLVECVRSEPTGPVGLHLSSLEAAYVALGRIEVSEGTGVDLGNVKLAEGLTVDSVSVGHPLGKSER